MVKVVRIVGEADAFEVLCETATTKVLVNRSAKLRLAAEDLDRRLASIRQQLVVATRSDVSGNAINAIDGP